MFNGLIHKLLLVVIAALLLPLHSYALDLAVVPGDVIPGDVFIFRIKDSGSLSVDAEFNGKKLDLYTSGDDLIALVPVSLNTAPGEYTIIARHGGEERTASVEVNDHEFKTIKLTLPEGKVILSPENLARSRKESKLLGDTWSRNTSMSWEGGFVSPTGTEISAEFGLNRIMNEKRNSRHRGTDFRGKAGTPVKAINSGTVALTGDLFFGGNTLVIDHGMGLYSIYMHLLKFNVSDGDSVSTDDIVGHVGMTGRATGPHLHMSVKLKGVSVNPESLFRLGL